MGTTEAPGPGHLIACRVRLRMMSLSELLIQAADRLDNALPFMRAVGALTGDEEALVAELEERAARVSGERQNPF